MRFASRVCLAVLLLNVCAQAGWKAGVGRVSITPTEALWMSGYAVRDRPADGKLTDLWAKALVLQDDAGHQGVMITLDLVGIDRQSSQRICQQLIDAHDLQRADIAICTSHTHSGPVFSSTLNAMYDLEPQQWSLLESYTQQVEADIVRIVGEAFANLADAELSWGVGHSTIAVNRRENREADVPQLREQGQLKGPVDYEVPVLQVAVGGKPSAVLFGYACHATTLNGYDWSGDWPGNAQQAIEKAHPGVTALFFAGCGADQNPIPRRRVELAEQYGQQMAQAVNDVLSGDLQPVAPTLATAYTEIDLPFAHVPSDEELQQTLQHENVYEVRRAKYQLDRYGSADKIPASYPYPVQTWRLGEVTGVILGGEVVVDYSLAIKGLEEGVDFVAGYSNDVMAYIPSERVLAEGRYEGATSMIYYGQPSPWQPGLEAVILETIGRQLKTVAP